MEKWNLNAEHLRFKNIKIAFKKICWETNFSQIDATLFRKALSHNDLAGRQGFTVQYCARIKF